MNGNISNEEMYMFRCLELANKGAGYVSPNPLVGSVIVKDGQIIGEGYHEKYGEAHAEVNAINNAKSKGYDLKGTELYVNLEPCSHSGKTPPCAKAIVSEGIQKVFIGMQDPYEEVNGGGIKILEDAGIEVSVGILKEQCEEINKFFITFVTKNRPYVSLKIAQSIDGVIALKNHESKWITGAESRKYVHYLRSIYDGVLVGKNTVKHDNPFLDVRDAEGRNPYRIIIDKANELPRDLNVFKNDDGKTILITFVSSDEQNTKEVWLESRNGFAVEDILKKLYEMNIASVLIEGGAHTFANFLKSDLYDDIYFFVAPKILGEGIRTFNDLGIDSLNSESKLRATNVFKLENDTLIYCRK
ncbi:MAG TPA: bifunctional diaminohydroxyphosphoribosylaminopyrimidine deaminase/5-amino-6-(5-phosphoribosylamino)uracil reductase RibD [Ignavibacteria bacterium]|nr:bifunctional diaminohydroxyphosphoribosylaminopyrimidine deaminase/5-amino-6-(5-phosphoribosylamino)uracil reductase RibD [Ignavibacteria bacterium]